MVRRVAASAGRPSRCPEAPAGPHAARAGSLPPLATGPVVPRSVQLRNAVPGLLRHLPHHKPWMVALGVIAVAVVLSTCGLGSFLLFRDDQQLAAHPAPPPTVPKRDISSRTVDPTPLTAADVFPVDKITADPAVPPYLRVGEPQVNADCRAAATGDLGKLLVASGCNQVVRATFSSTDGTYFVTAGIFNLLDATAAAKAQTDIKAIDATKGRLGGYISDPGDEGARPRHDPGRLGRRRPLPALRRDRPHGRPRTSPPTTRTSR